MKDKIFKEKIQESAFDELVSDFDQEAIWRNIQVQASSKKEPKKNNSLLVFWRYAAVLAIGLFLGFYFNNRTQSEIISAHKTIVKQVVKDTLFVEQPIAQKMPIAKPKLKNQLHAKAANKMVQLEVKKKPMAETIVQETVAAVKLQAQPMAARKELEVVYFSDLAFANTPIAHYKAKRQKRKFIQLNLPENNEAVSQEPPIRNLILALK